MTSVWVEIPDNLLRTGCVPGFVGRITRLAQHVIRDSPVTEGTCKASLFCAVLFLISSTAIHSQTPALMEGDMAAARMALARAAQSNPNNAAALTLRRIPDRYGDPQARCLRQAAGRAAQLRRYGPGRRSSPPSGAAGPAGRRSRGGVSQRNHGRAGGGRRSMAHHQHPGTLALVRAHGGGFGGIARRRHPAGGGA